MASNERCPHDEGTRASRLWRRGWNACRNGKSPDHCPARQDPDRNHWINGYTAAQLRAELHGDPGAPDPEESDGIAE